MTSRQIAQSIVALSGQDARDKRYTSDVTKRVSKALKALRGREVVRSAPDAQGNLLWSVGALPRSD